MNYNLTPIYNSKKLKTEKNSTLNIKPLNKYSTLECELNTSILVVYIYIEELT